MYSVLRDSDCSLLSPPPRHFESGLPAQPIDLITPNLEPFVPQPLVHHASHRLDDRLVFVVP
jgi:hypothetical protein